MRRILLWKNFVLQKERRRGEKALFEGDGKGKIQKKAKKKIWEEKWSSLCETHGEGFDNVCHRRDHLAVDELLNGLNEIPRQNQRVQSVQESQAIVVGKHHGSHGQPFETEVMTMTG